jgi:trk system potassium uptake protein TrkA
VRVFVIGAGLVGAMVVEALHADHDITVVDLEPASLKPLAQRFDVATVAASAVSGRELTAAGIADSELVIACTSRDEANLVAGTFAHIAAPTAKTIVRTTSAEYVDIWREGRLDVDFVVSSEVEAARAVSAAIGMPTARHTDTFAEGDIQIVEVDVSEEGDESVVGRPLRTARQPDQSRVAAIIRDDCAELPSGDAVLVPGDRVVVVGSPVAARAWCELVSPRRGHVRDVVVSGARELAAAIARALLGLGLQVRVIEPDPARAALVAEQLPSARVFNTSGTDADFLEREGIARMQAAIFAMREDPLNAYAAVLAKREGVPYTIALAHEPQSADVYEHIGINITIDPQLVTSEEIVRFAHDPRTHQVSMLEHDRFELLDITTRPDGRLVGMALREMPITGALIAAIVRGGRAIFPRSSEVLQAGDRVIVFTETSRVPEVERSL